MLSTYYMVKLFQKATSERKKQEPNFRDYVKSNNCFSDDSLAKETKHSARVNKCRACLKEGSIPIFNKNSDADLSVAFQMIGDIEISEDDDYPKLLCELCHEQLQGAILFRETVKQSQKILESKLRQDTLSCGNRNKKKIKKEKIEMSKPPSVLQNYFESENDDETEKKSFVKVNRKITKVLCRLCGKKITKSYFKQHLALHTDEPNNKYVCDVCGKCFYRSFSYKNHLSTHINEFPYNCELCSYRGRNSGLLKTHMLKHIGDYKYVCDECPAKFLTKSNLNKHSFKHKEPIIQCNACDRAFHTKLMLNRHFEVEHLNVKNHLCNLCGKAFGYRKAMMRHQLHAHNREKKLSGRAPAYLEAPSYTLD